MDNVRSTGKQRYRIMVEVCPSDDLWCWDTGPTFVYGKEEEDGRQGQRRLVGIDWGFNAYGVPEEGC